MTIKLAADFEGTLEELALEFDEAMGRIDRGLELLSNVADALDDECSAHESLTEAVRLITEWHEYASGEMAEALEEVGRGR